MSEIHKPDQGKKYKQNKWSFIYSGTDGTAVNFTVTMVTMPTDSQEQLLLYLAVIILIKQVGGLIDVVMNDSSPLASDPATQCYL